MMKRRRKLGAEETFRLAEADDPMNSIGNLLDIFLVFAVAILVAFLSVFNLQELLSADSTITVMKQSSDGEMTIITKRFTTIEAVRITKSEAEGKGVRLGVAYRLEDGSMVYLPDVDEYEE